MFWISLLLLLFSALIWWSGALQPFVLVCLILAAAAGLLYEIFRISKEEWYLQEQKRKLKAKWGANFYHGYGLELFPGQMLRMLVSRRDELIFQGEDFARVLSLSDIRGILIIRSDQIRRHSDAELRELNQMDDLPALGSVRAYLSRGSRLNRQPLLLLFLRPSEEGEGKNLFIALQAVRGGKILHAFLRRPEIRGKAQIFKEGNRRRNSRKNDEVLE